MVLVLISLYPLGMVLGYAAQACNCLLAGMQAAATYSHLPSISVYTAHITQIVGGQLCVILCADAGALIGIDLFARHRAVLLQRLCVCLPGLPISMCYRALFGRKKHLQSNKAWLRFSIFCALLESLCPLCVFGAPSLLQQITRADTLSVLVQVPQRKQAC